MFRRRFTVGLVYRLSLFFEALDLRHCNLFTSLLRQAVSLAGHAHLGGKLLELASVKPDELAARAYVEHHRAAVNRQRHFHHPATTGWTVSPPALPIPSGEQP